MGGLIQSSWYPFHSKPPTFTADLIMLPLDPQRTWTMPPKTRSLWDMIRRLKEPFCWFFGKKLTAKNAKFRYKMNILLFLDRSIFGYFKSNKSRNCPSLKFDCLSVLDFDPTLDSPLSHLARVKSARKG